MKRMQAMVLESSHRPLRAAELAVPQPGPGQVLLQVGACAVCRTDLHVVDGELTNPRLPLILGHEIVGRVRRRGPGADRFADGERVGVPWLGWACGSCKYCRSDRENLCGEARFTGYTLNSFLRWRQPFRSGQRCNRLHCPKPMKRWPASEPVRSAAQRS